MDKIYKAKTRQEIADELGISVTTLWRLLKKHSIKLPSGLVYPDKQKEIYRQLLHSPAHREGLSRSDDHVFDAEWLFALKNEKFWKVLNYFEMPNINTMTLYLPISMQLNYLNTPN